MTHLTEILEGYCDPATKKYAFNAVGETGLTARIHWLTYLGTAIQALIRPHIYELGQGHFYETYWPILQTYRESWATEFLRITDRAATSGRTNLTISLFHERWQADLTVPVDLRACEKERFDALMRKYDSHELWLFRCRHHFHVDLGSNLQPPNEANANIHEMTMLVLSWYKCVGTYVFNGEPKYVTKGAVNRGRDFARQLRRMMVTTLRARRSRFAD